MVATKCCWHETIVNYGHKGFPECSQNSWIISFLAKRPLSALEASGNCPEHHTLNPVQVLYLSRIKDIIFPTAMYSTLYDNKKMNKTWLT